MYNGNLFATVNSVINMWAFHRKQSKQFRRWLEKGTALISAHDRNLNMLASLLVLAIIEGVDEMAFLERRLRGLYQIETHPDFWKIDATRAFDEGLRAHQEDMLGDNPQAVLDHFARFNGFSRIDRYQSIDGTVDLADGYEIQSFRPCLQILRENLQHPRMLSIVNEYPDRVLKGRRCTVAVVDHACGIEIPRDCLGLKFAYTN